MFDTNRYDVVEKRLAEALKDIDVEVEAIVEEPVDVSSRELLQMAWDRAEQEVDELRTELRILQQRHREAERTLVARINQRKRLQQQILAGRLQFEAAGAVILKSGCKVEELQLEKLERLEPALAFYMIIAWRVLYLTMLGRDCPQMPCDAVFADEEWRAVYLVTQRQAPPDTPPSLDTMVRMVASLGGFLNRKHDGFPGPKTLWIGLQRIPDFVLALEAQRSIEESCG
mgnify:CR=1 FL=1